MANIGTKIRQTREALGLTQEDLASRAGVSQGSIGHVESGLRKRPQKLPEIARALGVSAEWLADEADVEFEEWLASHGSMVRRPQQAGDAGLEVLSLDGVSNEMRAILIELKNIDKADDSRRTMLIASIGAMLASTANHKRRR